MKRTLSFLLLIVLMTSCIGNVSAAPKVQAKTTKTSATTISKGWSKKAKVFATACTIVGGCIATYLLYRKWLSNVTSKRDANALYEFERQQNDPRYQIPAGRPGQLMHNILANNVPCQEAMRNLENRANIERLFNNEEFRGLIEGRFGGFCEEQMIALFNEPAIIQMSAQPNFDAMVLAEFHRRHDAALALLNR